MQTPTLGSGSCRNHATLPWCSLPATALACAPAHTGTGRPFHCDPPPPPPKLHRSRSPAAHLVGLAGHLAHTAEPRVEAVERAGGLLPQVSHPIWAAL